ncbi:MAG: 1-acyl-sn-glycerol-3-phosphate acyltransferase [Deltaproteobacteria bacterium]|jgi:1-acyl-sn-glycerol-3-phosphate acyltransferase|nr:1-acyl-sn-glycerol-3-phosphate acyltransferase [Deltaproteobacteria bacterium]MBW2537736.1 1-acyl-sn-glycerol-3-phosphate acyltransferase [Deltaproteobacteria bacterium]
MSLRDKSRWLRQWVPFGARTIGYGTISITLGPLTGDHRASAWAARQWSRSTMRGLGIAVEVDGLERVPSGAVVYASNHQSLLDILVLGAVLPGDFKWATKRSVMNVPFLGWHLRLAGHVPVDRSQGKSTAVVVAERFEQVLRAGKPLLVFPEGTRSQDGQLKAFKNGGFYAAVRAGRPVLPIALEGTYGLMSRDAVDTGEMAERESRLVRVRIGAPLEPATDGSEEERIVDLRDRTRVAVAAMLDELRH